VLAALLAASREEAGDGASQPVGLPAGRRA